MIIQTNLFSGDNDSDGRDCERWKESMENGDDPIAVEKTYSALNSIDFITVSS